MWCNPISLKVLVSSIIPPESFKYQLSIRESSLENIFKLLKAGRGISDDFILIPLDVSQEF